MYLEPVLSWLGERECECKQLQGQEEWGGGGGPGGELCRCIVHAVGGPGLAAAVEVFAGVMV